MSVLFNSLRLSMLFFALLTINLFSQADTLKKGTDSISADHTPSFDELHVKLLQGYLVFADSMERKEIDYGYFSVRRRSHVSVMEFTDGVHFYTIHKYIRMYKSGLRLERIRWYMNKGGFLHKIYVIKTLGLDYRYIKHFEYNEHWKKTRRTICLDDNYIQVWQIRPHTRHSKKFYLKRESSLPGSHQMN